MMEEVGVSPSKARSSGILSAVWYDGGGVGGGGCALGLGWGERYAVSA
jgi:hypothetical protein